MPTTTASTYDPAQGGINGNPNATPCRVPVGQLPWSIAHKTAPCGSIVTITRNDGKEPIVQTVVADRGPYIKGRDLDLRPDVASALGSTGLIGVHYAISAHRVNLREYAKAGGNAAAFEKLTGKVASSKDPLGKKTDEQAAADAQANALSYPGSDTVNAVGNSIAGGVKVLGGFLANIQDPKVWLRIGEILFGGIILLIALDKLTGGAMSGAVKTGIGMVPK